MAKREDKDLQASAAKDKAEKLGCYLEDDDAFEKLFASFDSVHVSDTLKASTRDAIAALQTQQEKQTQTTQATVAISSSSASNVTSFLTAKKSSTKNSTKKRLRLVRIMVLAACLAAFGVGGVAYATPTSYVEIGDENMLVTLGVNVFGITVSAQSDTDEGKTLITKNNVKNMNYADSLKMLVAATESLETNSSEYTVSVAVSSDDDGQSGAIADTSSEVLRGSGYAKNDCNSKSKATDSPNANSSESNDSTNDSQDDSIDTSAKSKDTDERSNDSAKDTDAADDAKSDVNESNKPDRVETFSKKLSSKGELQAEEPFITTSARADDNKSVNENKSVNNTEHFEDQGQKNHQKSEQNETKKNAKALSFSSSKNSFDEKADSCADVHEFSHACE